MEVGSHTTTNSAHSGTLLPETAVGQNTEAEDMHGREGDPKHLDTILKTGTVLR